MFWYDDYELPEPSDVDLIVHEAIEKLEEYIVDNTKIRINDILNRAKEWEDKYNKKVQEYRELDKLLSQKRNRVEELEKELEAKRTELGILPFEVGEEVYCIYLSYSDTIKLTCPRCNGTGHVTITCDGVIYKSQCPICKDSCYGDHPHKESSYRLLKVGKHTIDYIKQEIKLDDKTKKPKAETFYTIDGNTVQAEYIRKCLPGGSYNNESTIKELHQIVDEINKEARNKCLIEVGREVPNDE